MRHFRNTGTPASLLPVLAAVLLTALPLASCVKEEFAEADFDYSLSEYRQSAVFEWSPSADGTLRCPDQSLSGLTVTAYNRVALQVTSDDEAFNGVSFSTSDSGIIALENVGSDGCELVYSGYGTATITMTAGTKSRSFSVRGASIVPLQGVNITVGGRAYRVEAGTTGNPNFLCLGGGSIPAGGGEELVIVGLEPENASYRYVREFEGASVDNEGVTFDDVNRKHYGTAVSEFCKDGRETDFDFSVIEGRKMFFDHEAISRGVLHFAFDRSTADELTRAGSDTPASFCAELSYWTTSSQNKDKDVTPILFSDGTSAAGVSILDYERAFYLTLDKYYDRNFTVTVPEDAADWLTAVCVNEKTASENRIWFHVRSCPGTQSRSTTAKVTASDGGTTALTVSVSQVAEGAAGSLRHALVAFYDAMNGEGWEEKDAANWCSDEPVSEWKGVSSDNIQEVRAFKDTEGIFDAYVGTDDVWQLDRMCMGELQGTIPEEFWDAAKWFSEFDFTNDNSLEGNVVPDRFWHSNLEVADFHGTYVCYHFGESIYDSEKLRVFDLGVGDGTGGLTGQMPDLTKFPNLEEFDAYRSEITGTLPENIGTLKNLQEISLSGEGITGALSESFYELENLRIVNVSATKIGGTISKKISQLKNLNQFYINDNDFEGEFPEEFGNLPKCPKYLIAHNHFTKAPELFRYRAGVPDPKGYMGRCWDDLCYHQDFVQTDKVTGKYVNLWLYYEPEWITVRYGTPAVMKSTKTPVWPYADDLQYSAMEYYYDGKDWRHPNYEYPAAEYWNDGTGWVHEPGNPWSQMVRSPFQDVEGWAD